MDRFRHQHHPELSGYLAKTGRIPPRRKKFFFRLSGSVLSRHRSQVCNITIIKPKSSLPFYLPSNG